MPYTWFSIFSSFKQDVKEKDIESSIAIWKYFFIKKYNVFDVESDEFYLSQNTGDVSGSGLPSLPTLAAL